MLQFRNPLRLKEKLFRVILKRKRAVSPLIATILIFALIILGVGIGLTQTLPYIEMTKSRASLTNLQTTFNQIDSSINDLLNEGIKADNAGLSDESGQRYIMLTKSMGKLEFPSSINFFNLRLVDKNRDPLYNSSTGFEIEPLFGINYIALGQLDYSFSSTAAIIPLNTWMYMTGPQIYRRREAVSVIAPVQEESYSNMANITLSYTRVDFNYHLRLDYRPKVLISILFTPEPEIRISTYLIQLSGPSQAVISEYSQLLLSLSSIEFQKSTYTLRSDISEFVIQTKTHPSTGWIDCWSSDLVQGLNPASYQISLSKTIYSFVIS